MFKQKTKISKARTNNSSVRTTLPAPIAQMLNLKPGDLIEWTVESEDNKLNVTVTKVE